MFWFVIVLINSADINYLFQKQEQKSPPDNLKPYLHIVNQYNIHQLQNNAI